MIILGMALGTIIGGIFTLEVAHISAYPGMFTGLVIICVTVVVQEIRKKGI